MRGWRYAVTIPAVLACLAPVVAAQAPSPVQFVKMHLDEALGPPEARMGGAREVRGACQVEARQSGTGALGGSFSLATDATSTRLLINFGTENYEGEKFIFDGSKTDIGFAVRPSARKSALADFMAAHDVILREGLLGGVLNAGWPLLDLAARQVRLDSGGLKDFDGRRLYRLRYRAKSKQGELDIYLFFDPTSFRHVASVYSWSRAQNLGTSMESSSQQSEVNFRLEERFADFERIGGLTLPTTWSIDFEQSANTTLVWRYKFKVASVERK
jgi:hypothetical protein